VIYILIYILKFTRFVAHISFIIQKTYTFVRRGSHLASWFIKLSNFVSLSPARSQTHTNTVVMHSIKDNGKYILGILAEHQHGKLVATYAP
jgi:hypothetical protein